MSKRLGTILYGLKIAILITAGPIFLYCLQHRIHVPMISDVGMAMGFIPPLFLLFFVGLISLGPVLLIRKSLFCNVLALYYGITLLGIIPSVVDKYQMKQFSIMRSAHFAEAQKIADSLRIESIEAIPSIKNLPTQLGVFDAWRVSFNIYLPDAGDYQYYVMDTPISIMDEKKSDIVYAVSGKIYRITATDSDQILSLSDFKTALSPGSYKVEAYLDRLNLRDLDKIDGKICNNSGMVAASEFQSVSGKEDKIILYLTNPFRVELKPDSASYKKLRNAWVGPENYFSNISTEWLDPVPFVAPWMPNDWLKRIAEQDPECKK